jgi:hypothetical protein
MLLPPQSPFEQQHLGQVVIVNAFLPAHRRTRRKHRRRCWRWRCIIIVVFVVVRKIVWKSGIVRENFFLNVSL